MKILQNRPILWVSVAFLSAFFLSPLLSERIKMIFIAVFFGIGIASILFSVVKKEFSKRISILLLVLAGAVCALFSAYLYFDRSVGAWNEKAGTSATVEAIVTDVSFSSVSESQYEILVLKAEGNSCFYRAKLHTDYLSALQKGDSFRAKVNYLAWEESDKYFSGDDSGSFGYFQIESKENCEISEKSRLTFLLRMQRLNLQLSLRLKNTLQGENGALATALLLGNRSFLSDKTTLEFRRTGISHLLALSGMHISILLGGLDWFLKKLSVSKRFRSIVVPLFGLGYLFLSGMALSTVRAVIMASFLYFAFLSKREYDALSALFASLLVTLFLMPYSVSDASLWLSYSAVFGILVFAFVPIKAFQKAYQNRLSKWLYRICYITISVISVGFFANCSILPVSALYYGQTSLFSIPATILLSPLLSVILILSLGVLILPGATPFVWTLNILLTFLQKSAEILSEPKLSLLSLHGTFQLLLISLLAASVLFLAILPIKRKAWICVCPLLLLAVMVCSVLQALFPKQEVGITYLQGTRYECILLTQGAEAVFIDTGNASIYPTSAIQNTLQEEHCTEISEWVLTHYHIQTPSLVSSLSGKIKIRKIILPKPTNEEETAIAARIQEAAENQGIEITNEFDFGNLNIGLDFIRRTQQGVGKSGVILQLTVNQKRVTYLPTGWENENQAIGEELIATADVLMFGGVGAKHQKDRIRLSLSKNLQLLLFANQEIESEYYVPFCGLQTVIASENEKFYIKQSVVVSETDCFSYSVTVETNGRSL